MSRILAELSRSLKGVRGILHFDANALRLFAPGAGPLVRSFQVALWILPLQAWIIWLDRPEDVNPDRYLVCQAAAYAVSWVLYPLILVPLSAYFHCRDRLSAYLTAYNWFQLAEMVAMSPLNLLWLLKFLPDGAYFPLWMMGTLVLMIYEWFMLRKGLGVASGTASALVLIAFLLNQVLIGVAGVLT